MTCSSVVEKLSIFLLSHSFNKSREILSSPKQQTLPFSPGTQVSPAQQLQTPQWKPCGHKYFVASLEISLWRPDLAGNPYVGNTLGFHSLDDRICNTHIEVTERGHMSWSVFIIVVRTLRSSAQHKKAPSALHSDNEHTSQGSPSILLCDRIPSHSIRE